MPKFEKKYVHFMWDEELKGKEVCYSDYIGYLEDYVENNNLRFYGICNRQGNRDEPFLVNGVLRKFVYYDPYYDLKIARENGKVIQFKDSYGEWTDIEGDYTFSFDPDRYRIAPEVEERVTRRIGIADLPIGTKIIIKVVPYTSCDDCIFNTSTNDGCRVCGVNYRGDGTDIMFQVAEVEEPSVFTRIQDIGRTLLEN